VDARAINILRVFGLHVRMEDQKDVAHGRACELGPIAMPIFGPKICHGTVMNASPLKREYGDEVGLDAAPARKM